MTEKKFKIPSVFLSFERWNSAENGTWKNKLYNIFYILFWIFAALGFFLCRITWAGIWIFFLSFVTLFSYISWAFSIMWLLIFHFDSFILTQSIWLVGQVGFFYLGIFFGNYNQSIEPSACLDMFLSLFWSVAHKELFRCMFGTCF